MNSCGSGERKVIRGKPLPIVFCNLVSVEASFLSLAIFLLQLNPFCISSCLFLCFLIWVAAFRTIIALCDLTWALPYQNNGGRILFKQGVSASTELAIQFRIQKKLIFHYRCDERSNKRSEITSVQWHNGSSRLICKGRGVILCFNYDLFAQAPEIIFQHTSVCHHYLFCPLNVPTLLEILFGMGSVTQYISLKLSGEWRVSSSCIMLLWFDRKRSIWRNIRLYKINYQC